MTASVRTHTAWELGAYRDAARQMVEARALHRRVGDTDEALDAYRRAAHATAAARRLDRQHAQPG